MTTVSDSKIFIVGMDGWHNQGQQSGVVGQGSLLRMLLEIFLTLKKRMNNPFKNLYDNLMLRVPVAIQPSEKTSLRTSNTLLTTMQKTRISVLKDIFERLNLLWKVPILCLSFTQDTHFPYFCIFTCILYLQSKAPKIPTCSLASHVFF